MADKVGGYLRPNPNNAVSANYRNHRYERNPASSEPGTDYALPYGSTIRAAEDGIIAFCDTSAAGPEGRRIAVQHFDGQMTSDIHLSRLLLGNGTRVTRGQSIALSGASAWGKEWGVGAHVHRTLFPTHQLIFGTTRTLDFQTQEGADNDGGGGSTLYQQWVADVQNALNAYGQAGLVVDGILGPQTTSSILGMQKFLQGKDLYTGKLDGKWGPLTNTALNRYRDSLQVPPSQQFHTATVDDLLSLPNIGGLQKIAHLYGYTQKGWLDFTPGPGTRLGLQKFLLHNYGGSVAAWLRAKYGYVGNDQWGPLMKAAAMRAENANWKAL